MTTYTARFQPQYWDSHDYAIDAGPQTVWDVTHDLESAPAGSYLANLKTLLDENGYDVEDDVDYFLSYEDVPAAVTAHLRGEPYCGYVRIVLEEA